MFFKELFSKYKYLIIGLIVSFATTAIMLFLMALFMYFSNADADLINTLSAICLAIGSFIGSVVTAKIKKSQGLITGLLLSFLFFLIIVVISLIFSGKAFSILSLLHGIIMLLSGAIGGILGVNSKTKQLI